MMDALQMIVLWSVFLLAFVAVCALLGGDEGLATGEPPANKPGQFYDQDLDVNVRWDGKEWRPDLTPQQQAEVEKLERLFERG